jgi:hypothetical protein
MKFKHRIGSGEPQPPVTWRWVVYQGPPREEDPAAGERVRLWLADSDDDRRVRDNEID